MNLKGDEMNEDGEDKDNDNVDIGVVKERLRRELNYKRNRKSFY
jgi:hypothetical protein